MKHYLALGFLLLAAQACSNGDMQTQQPLKTEQKIASIAETSSASKKASMNEEGSSVALMSAENREKLESALCEKVAIMPDDYSQEEQILCSNRSQK